MPKISDLIEPIEQFAPTRLQESYDNAGLLTGNKSAECTGVLLSLDCIESIVDEAIANKCNLIIAHHPIIFKGLKSLTGKNYIERTIIKAIKNDIAIYACHTNIDNVKAGVNKKIADKLGLINAKVLQPKSELFYKLIVFVPTEHLEKVRTAILENGGGKIGEYDFCSFNTEGVGTFRAGENTNPFVGEKLEIHKENETRFETIIPKFALNVAIAAMKSVHPYEEVAYDLIPLDNQSNHFGSGLIGELPSEMDENAFLKHVKTVFKCKSLKHTVLTNKTIKKVALCGGSGQFLLKNAINSGADSYISGDFKYHEFFDADREILVIDVGHYESEQYTPEIFYEILSEKFPKFAIRLSSIDTNPVSIF
ncbi:MAG: Nif3-like dinuclear metal center hexameric protein [Bacteroidia bacterium]